MTLVFMLCFGVFVVRFESEDCFQVFRRCILVACSNLICSFVILLLRTTISPDGSPCFKFMFASNVIDVRVCVHILVL